MPRATTLQAGEVHVTLQGLRAERDLSVADAAEQMGVSRDTLLRAEAGTHIPQIGNAHKIAAFYGLAIGEVEWGTQPARLVRSDA